MSLLRLYPMLSFSVVLLAIVAQCLSQRHPWLLLLAGGLAALSRSVSEGPRGIALPRPLSLILTGIALMWAATIAAGDLSQPIPAIGQFVVWLTVIKLYERHTLENEAERLILSLLLMVLASLISIDLIFGFLLLAWTGLGIVTLMLFQLNCAAERMQMQRSKVLGIPPGGSPNPVAGPGLRRHYRNVSLLAMALVFGVSTIGFIVLPRGFTTSLSQATLGGLGMRDVGLGEGVDLLGSTRISLSGEQVLSVGLTNSAGEPIELGNQIRLRASVLTAYRGDGIWDVDPVGLDALELQSNHWRSLFFTPKEKETELITQEIILDAPSDQLLSMSVPVSIKMETDTTVDFRWSTQTMRVSHGSTPPLKYSVLTVPEPPLYRPQMSGPLVPESMLLHPYVNLQVRELAVELLEIANVPTLPPASTSDRLAWNVRVSEVFERYLKYGEFQYTLDLTNIGIASETADLDAVERFLIHEQFGHCEYFAAGLTGLCHSMQVPARLVTGYVSNRFDELSQRYIVVRSDAHAWVEVLGPGPQWKVFDPTPPANVPGTREAAMGPLEKMAWIWRWLEGQWRFNVLGFDTETQAYLSDAIIPDLESSISSGFKSTRRWVDRVGGSLGMGWSFSLVLVFIIVGGSVALLFSIRRRRRLIRILEQTDSLGARGQDRRRLAARLAFYVDMLDILRSAGLPKPSWQPPIAYAESLSSRHPEIATTMKEITSWYYRCRYGGLVTGDSSEWNVGEALARLDREVGGKHGA